MFIEFGGDKRELPIENLQDCRDELSHFFSLSAGGGNSQNREFALYMEWESGFCHPGMQLYRVGIIAWGGRCFVDFTRKKEILQNILHGSISRH